MPALGLSQGSKRILPASDHSHPAAPKLPKHHHHDEQRDMQPAVEFNSLPWSASPIGSALSSTPCTPRSPARRFIYGEQGRSRTAAPPLPVRKRPLLRNGAHRPPALTKAVTRGAMKALVAILTLRIALEMIMVLCGCGALGCSTAGVI